MPKSFSIRSSDHITGFLPHCPHWSPLAGMCSPVKMNHFPVYEGSRFQELDQVHDFRNLGQSVERTQFFQELMRLYLVHGSVHNTRRNGVETDPISRKLDRQRVRDKSQATFREIDETA